jgi:hypothetical protein
VNIAAGLVALAEPGGICISQLVRDRIGDNLPYIFEDRGRAQHREHCATGAHLRDGCDCNRVAASSLCPRTHGIDLPSRKKLKVPMSQFPALAIHLAFPMPGILINQPIDDRALGGDPDGFRC